MAAAPDPGWWIRLHCPVCGFERYGPATTTLCKNAHDPPRRLHNVDALARVGREKNKPWPSP